MSKDINLLTGIEFEYLCQTLLQKVGFEVETTKTSGDGGIDLIARNHQPFFSGKYIIQCKRYTGSVGEPIVRDLYGVVMAERANKGILLTTGHFTISAIRFSEDKNLELIDGDALNRLLLEYQMDNNEKPAISNHFTQYKCFDSQKYEFFKYKINQNECSLEMGHDFLFGFMFDYMKKAGRNKNTTAMLQAGFADEYLRLFDWYVGKYYRRGKENIKMLEHYNRKYKGLAQLINYDLFAYVQERYVILTGDCKVDINVRTKGELDAETLKIMNKGGKGSSAIMKDLIESGKVKLSFPEQGKNFYELMNLLGIFSYFNIESGINAINKKLYGRYPHYKGWVEMQKDYQNAIKDVKILYFDDDYCRQLSGSINLSSYYNQSTEHHKEKLREEISKIEAMIEAIF